MEYSRMDFLRERLAQPATAVVLAGGIALTGAGCTHNESAVPKNPEPVVSYEAPERANALPLVPQQAAASSSAGGPEYIDSGSLAYSIYDPKDFKSLNNPNAARGNDLPSGQSAPIVDIMIGTDGELRYKDNLKQPDTTKQKILNMVSLASPTLRPAMQSGQVSQVHFRVFKPHQYPGHPDWKPTADMRFVAHDNNDKGHPAIYYYFPATGLMDTQTASLVLKHETSHALLGQGEQSLLSPEETKEFNDACTTIHNSALAYIRQDSAAILTDLYYMRQLAPKDYAPAFDAVMNGIKKGTYGQLPNERLTSTDIPACNLQNPYYALVATIHNKNIRGGTIPEEMHTDIFEDLGQELVEDWNDVVKEDTIYRALSESTYLPGPSTRDKLAYGHPHEGKDELTASTANLALNVPDEFGQHVADLPDGQKEVILRVVDLTIASLKQRHATDTTFIKYIDTQYAAFAAKAQS